MLRMCMCNKSKQIIEDREEMEAKSRTSPLLTSYKMGKFTLSHRVVLPPLTRNRAFNNKPQAHSLEYYEQRATNGGFLISEAAAATDVSLRCPNMPGIWTDKQVEAWKPIVEAVHAKGGIIFCQLWHPARISNYTFAPEGSDLTKTIINKKVDGDYHSFDTTSRGSPHTTSEEGADVAAPDAPHAYIFGWAQRHVSSQNPLTTTPSVAPHPYILLDRVDSVAPHAFVDLGRENVVAVSPLASNNNNNNEDGSISPHAYILFDREDVAPSVAPHAYILFDREVVAAVSPLASNNEDGSISPHPYILLDREDAATTSPLGTNSEDGSITPHATTNAERSSGHSCFSAHRSEPHSVPILIADRVSATTTNDRDLDLVHQGVVSDKLSIEKSASIINDFALAARNAIKAGFDGVEINCAHGYLIERHLNEQVKNNMLDPYGGSLEKRCRLALDVVEAVTKEIGRDRVGIKLSPFDDFHGSGNLSPVVAGVYLATELNNLGLLYLHVTEPRMIKIGDTFKTPRSLQPIREAFEGTLIASGGYDKTDGDEAVAEDYADLVSFGRLFVANPDLPKRFELNAPLNKHDRSTFYVPEPVLGYTDYPSLQIVS